jgi:hypothetical protein
MDQEIVNYILQAQKHGLSDLEIKQNLLDAGWDAATVEQSFVFAKAADSHSGTGGSLASPAGYPSFQRPDLSRQPAAFQNTHTTIAISEQSFRQKSPKRPFFKNKVFWLVLVLLLVLSASAFGYYKYIYATPETVFNKFLAVKRPLAFQSDYSLGYSYTDASSTQPVTLNLSGTTYSNSQNASSSEYSNTFSLAQQSGAGGANINLQYLVINNILYFDISKISLLKSLGSDWVRLDLGQLQKYLSANSTTTGQSFNNFLANGELKTKLQNLIANAKIVNPGNSLTKETVKNVPVYHLKITLDSQALANTAQGVIDLIQNDPSFTGQKITDAQKNEISSVLKKFTLKEGDMWIGQKDSQLYQIHLSLNVPSAQDLSNSNFINSVPVLDQSLEKRRDATRLSDAKQIEQALQLYYNDHGGYPEGVTGVPQGLVPNYISAWPAIPTPFDGTCTNYFNSYWYKNVGTGFTKNGIKLYPSFTFTFCLGQATGGYDAGIGMITSKGLAGNVPCPGPLDKCVNKNPAVLDDFQAKIDKLQFNSSLVFDDTFYNFGKTQTLELPKDSLDLMQSLQSLLGSQLSSSSTNQTLAQ